MMDEKFDRKSTISDLVKYGHSPQKALEIAIESA